MLLLDLVLRRCPCVSQNDIIKRYLILNTLGLYKCIIFNIQHKLVKVFCSFHLHSFLLIIIFIVQWASNTNVKLASKYRLAENFSPEVYFSFFPIQMQPGDLTIFQLCKALINCKWQRRCSLHFNTEARQGMREGWESSQRGGVRWEDQELKWLDNHVLFIFNCCMKRERTIFSFFSARLPQCMDTCVHKLCVQSLNLFILIF